MATTSEPQSKSLFSSKIANVVSAFALIILMASCSSQSCQSSRGSGAVQQNGNPQSTSHVVLLLDKSASMEFLVYDVLGGFNTLVSKLPVDSHVSLFGFESINGLETIFSYEPVNSLRQLTISDYQLGDGTPLYDAVSQAIISVDQITVSQSASGEQILFIIISDGLENSSTRYSLSDTRERIQDKLNDGWDIRFFGLGTDAASEASNLGIPLTDGSNFSPDQSGVQDVFDNIAGSFTQSQPVKQCQRITP